MSVAVTDQVRGRWDFVPGPASALCVTYGESCGHREMSSGIWANRSNERFSAHALLAGDNFFI